MLGYYLECMLIYKKKKKKTAEVLETKKAM